MPATSEYSQVFIQCPSCQRQWRVLSRWLVHSFDKLCLGVGVWPTGYELVRMPGPGGAVVKPSPRTQASQVNVPEVSPASASEANGKFLFISLFISLFFSPLFSPSLCPPSPLCVCIPFVIQIFKIKKNIIKSYMLGRISGRVVKAFSGDTYFRCQSAWT